MQHRRQSCVLRRDSPDSQEFDKIMSAFAQHFAPRKVPRTQAVFSTYVCGTAGWLTGWLKCGQMNEWLPILSTALFLGIDV